MDHYSRQIGNLWSHSHLVETSADSNYTYQFVPTASFIPWLLVGGFLAHKLVV